MSRLLVGAIALRPHEVMRNPSLLPDEKILQGEEARVFTEAARQLIIAGIKPDTSSLISRLPGVGAERYRRAFVNQDAALNYLQSCIAEASGISVETALEQTKNDYARKSLKIAIAEIQDIMIEESSAEEMMTRACERIVSALDGTIAERDAIEAADAIAQWTAMAQRPDSGIYYEQLFPTHRFFSKIRPSNIIVVGAPSGHGKSFLGLEYAEKLAGAGCPVAYFTMEMSRNELIERQILMGGFSEEQIELGKIDYLAIEDRLNELKALPITFYENATTIDRIQTALIRARIAGRPYKAVVIDHLHLMTILGKEGYRLGMNEMLSKMRLLANREQCVFIVLAQLRRPPQDDKDYVPRMSDLKESSAIEQIADYIFMLNRDTDPETHQVLTEGSIYCPKRRNGKSIPRIRVRFDSEKVRFRELELQSGRW